MAELVRRSGREQNYISDLLHSERKSFGEKAARALEASLKLDPGELDIAPAKATEQPRKTRKTDTSLPTLIAHRAAVLDKDSQERLLRFLETLSAYVNPKARDYEAQAQGGATSYRQDLGGDPRATSCPVSCKPAPARGRLWVRENTSNGKPKRRLFTVRVVL